MNLSRALLNLVLAVAPFARSVSATEIPKPPASPRDIPIEAFINEPDFSSPALSPDGKYVAFAAELGTGRRGVALLHVETGKIEPLVGPEDSDVTKMFWEGNDTIVFTGWLPRVAWNGVRSISIGSREVVALSGTANYRDSLGLKQNFVFIEDPLPSVHGKFLAVGFLGKGSDEWAYMQMDARTGELTKLEGDEGSSLTMEVLADIDGINRARQRSERGRLIYEVRPKAGGEYRKAGETLWTEPRWSLKAIGGDGNTTWVVVIRETPGASLHAIDMETAVLGPALFEVPDGTIESVILSRDRKTLEGVLIDRGRPSYHWFDQRRARLQAQIDASLSGTFNEIVSSSDDGRFHIIRAWSDRDEGTFYLLDRKTPRLSLLGRARNGLDPKLMRPMEPIQFKARDGVEIHGFLTRAAGNDGGPAPLIVHPHKGPFDTRDGWGFDSWVQFLASRGYSVLQVNFRGSTGYGAAFERAGWGEIGGKIQDDITDAVQWAIVEGIADRTRVAIFGTGHGGYAALAGLGKTPGLYRCAVAYLPGIDYDNEVGAYSPDGPRSREYEKVRYEDKPEVRDERSMRNLAEKFDAPLLYINFIPDKDDHDTWWLAIRTRLVKHDKPFEEMIVKDRKIYENFPKHRLDAFKRIEAFLLKHMPPDGCNARTTLRSTVHNSAGALNPAMKGASFTPCSRGAMC